MIRRLIRPVESSESRQTEHRAANDAIALHGFGWTDGKQVAARTLP
jgi:hypothetical protein